MSSLCGGSCSGTGCLSSYSGCGAVGTVLAGGPGVPVVIPGVCVVTVGAVLPVACEDTLSGCMCRSVCGWRLVISDSACMVLLLSWVCRCLISRF